MTTLHNDRIDELQSLVTDLGRALVLSERRTTRLERMVRWMMLCAFLATGALVLSILQPLGMAIAQQDQPSQSVEQAIDRLTTSLTGERSTIGMMGQMLGEMVRFGTLRAVQEAEALPALTEADCAPGATLPTELREKRIKYQLGFYAKCYFIDRGITEPTPQDFQQAVIAAASGTAVDLGVLASRLRDDSDLIRSFVVAYAKDSKDLLTKIGNQLVVLNRTLEAIPMMNANMATMTHQMGIMAADMNSMTYSMGSTMGRMGKWMPW